jgi:hypothetical protein
MNILLKSGTTYTIESLCDSLLQTNNNIYFLVIESQNRDYNAINSSFEICTSFKQLKNKLFEHLHDMEEYCNSYHEFKRDNIIGCNMSSDHAIYYKIYGNINSERYDKLAYTLKIAIQVQNNENIDVPSNPKSKEELMKIINLYNNKKNAEKIMDLKKMIDRIKTNLFFNQINKFLVLNDIKCKIGENILFDKNNYVFDMMFTDIKLLVIFDSSYVMLDKLHKNIVTENVYKIQKAIDNGYCVLNILCEYIKNNANWGVEFVSFLKKHEKSQLFFMWDKHTINPYEEYGFKSIWKN